MVHYQHGENGGNVVEFPHVLGQEYDLKGSFRFSNTDPTASTGDR
ncbi:hypothetical protein D320_06859 [Haloferax sp. BAB-2207]|nr:hypothetical protein D320_06859 [Haloferax sp. BAB-2207]